MLTPGGSSKDTQPSRVCPAVTLNSPLSKLVQSVIVSTDEV